MSFTATSILDADGVRMGYFPSISYDGYRAVTVMRVLVVHRSVGETNCLNFTARS